MRSSEISRSRRYQRQQLCSTPSPRLTRLTVLVALTMIASVAILLTFHLNTWSNWSFSNAQLSTPIYSVEVINEYPHDRGAFTQGLLYGGNDTLFESTGLNGRSSVRKVVVQTGEVEVLQKMDNTYFGEGLTLLEERLYQLTWLTNTGFIYDRNDLSRLTKFTHQMEDGWGLATDGKVIFGSDGSSVLYQIDPQTMKVLERHTVRYEGREVHNINELEFVNGEVWANVFQTDCIARISQDDGSVLGWIILPELREGLLRAGERGIDVLNGIAWDSERDRLFLTGKLWPKLYEIKVQPVRRDTVGVDVHQLCMREPFHF